VAAACDPAAVILKQGPQKGGAAVEAIVGEAQSLNPLFAAEDNARDIDSLVVLFDQLIGRRPVLLAGPPYAKLRQGSHLTQSSPSFHPV